MTVGTATLPAGSTAAQAHAEELPGELTPTLDSVVFPAFVREHQDERRVRPALAVLFRIAVGQADSPRRARGIRLGAHAVNLTAGSRTR